MELVSFTVDGRTGFGVVAGGGIVDAGSRLGCTLRDVLVPGALAERARALAHEAPDFALDAVTLGLPVPDPEKIVCVGRNYRDHTLNAGGQPGFPTVFTRQRDSLVPHGAALVKPALSDQFDFEGELALVIGRPGRHIARADALSHIAAYACFNDGSVRDVQFDHSLTAGKNFFRSGAFGPWLTTADEVPDPAALRLRTRVNGVQVQDAPVTSMIFDIPAIIAYVSGFTPLAAGDVIATGSPIGTGFSRKPPVWLRDGDVVEVDIEGVGTLRNTVVAE
jgi:2-keto-4-pentenoate hydratase/2-oxohepta-3-ene-1,7-dioic acid hydratase in catechol pathway